MRASHQLHDSQGNGGARSKKRGKRGKGRTGGRARGREGGRVEGRTAEMFRRSVFAGSGRHRHWLWSIGRLKYHVFIRPCIDSEEEDDDEEEEDETKGKETGRKTMWTEEGEEGIREEGWREVRKRTDKR